MAMVAIYAYVLLAIMVPNVKTVRTYDRLFFRTRIRLLLNMDVILSFLSGDPCAQNPCLNGGRCVANTIGGFTCVCITPYTGQRCEDGKNRRL